MRLTLRTLLAYLDDILDPADKEELAKKVESSDFAEELIHRTRDTTRRLRLSAPQVVGTGMGLDPNTVAEYLDNVLPPDSVGDFERICLESDMHLAEVASCHHVLTMVLGEPADIDPAVRERMHTIPAQADNQRRFRIENAHVAANDGTAAQPLADDVLPVPSAAPAANLVDQSIYMEVPDYLRAKGWSVYRTAFVTIAAVLLVVAAVLLVPALREQFGNEPNVEVAAGGPVETDAAIPISRPAAGVAAPTVSANQNDVLTPNNVTEPVDSSLAISSEPTLPVTPLPAVTDTILPPPTPNMATDVAPTEIVEPAIGSMDVAIDENALTPTLPLTPPQTPAVSENTMPAADLGASADAAAGMPTDIGANFPEWPLGAGATGGLPAESMPATMPGAGAGMMPRPFGGGMPETAVESSANIGAETPDIPLTAEGPQVLNIGTYQGGKTVFLRFNPSDGEWFRMEPLTAVLFGDRLLSLPEFRPKVSFPSGVQMDVSGGTQITVKTADAVSAEGLPPGDVNTPAIEVVYGRIVLFNTANEEQRVRVTAGTYTVDVRLSRNVPLGVQVSRDYVPGVDPRAAAAPVIATFIAPAGGAVIIDRSGEQPITEPVQWTIADGVAAQPVRLTTPAPEWIDREPTGQRSELLAVPVVEAALTTDKPAGIQMLELYAGGRKREVKSLAARSSIYVGMFVPFIEALRDSDQRSNWRSHIDTLRSAMSLSPELASQVWETLIEQRGDRAAVDLYEMLCGYSREQVGLTRAERLNGPLARLIGWLESDNLDYRVLAVENLYDTTGKRLLQNPVVIGPPDRNPGIRNWKERLASDELMPTVPQ